MFLGVSFDAERQALLRANATLPQAHAAHVRHGRAELRQGIVGVGSSMRAEDPKDPAKKKQAGWIKCTIRI